MAMKSILTASCLVVGLAGCISAAEQQAQDITACHALGFDAFRNSDTMTLCLGQRAQQRALARAEAQEASDTEKTQSQINQLKIQQNLQQNISGLTNPGFIPVP
jgi:hypothetical protein